MAIKKIDSNVTGLSIAYEAEIGVLPVTPVFYPLEPNSYGDFGPSLSTVARSPITRSRQRKKGTTTDLDATANFNQDLTQNNLTRHLQGFFFADLRQKPSTAPMNAVAIALTGVDDTTGYAATAGLGIFASGNLVKASGFNLSANNGLKQLTAASATAVVAAGLVDEASPPVAAYLEKVGHQFASGDISFAVNGNLSRMVSAANAIAALGIIPGEWVFVGGDAAGTTSTTQKGFARASVVTAGYVEFDKTDWTPAVDAGTGKTIRVFVGNVLRTEDDPALQKRRSGTIERTLGNAGTGEQAEYVAGSVANTLAINMPQADKITVDLGFIATEAFSRDGATGPITGTHVIELSEDAFNTSQDFSRIKLSLVDSTASNVTPLFAYVTDLTLNISNNCEGNKALGVLGSFDVSAGLFTADGQITAYFVDTTSTLAIRNNADVTIDVVIARNHSGQVWDIPLLGLGGGMLTVEANKPIMIPLDMAGAQSKFGHTLLYVNFPYLPSAAY